MYCKTSFSVFFVSLFFKEEVNSVLELDNHISNMEYTVKNLPLANHNTNTAFKVTRTKLQPRRYHLRQK